MRVKTSELEGAALDWATGYAVYKGAQVVSEGWKFGEEWLIPGREDYGSLDGPWSPSTDWSQGGPLIDRYIGLTQHDEDDSCEPLYAEVRYASKEGYANGTTLLVAAMRAIVAAELGDEVDVPEELCSE